MQAAANPLPSTTINENAARVLVVDDEPAIVDAVTYNLRQQGYQPLVATDADAALRLFRERKPDLIILDVMLPSGSGFDICRLIRQGGGQTPILMLTARVAESDRVHGLEIGADDYLIKPFGMRELMARVKALLRRGTQNSESITSGVSVTALTGTLGIPLPSTPTIMASSRLGLVIDVEKRDARTKEKNLVLSRKEFDLLALLAAHPGRVFDRQTLLDRVWGEDAYVDDRTVDVHIRWLREKIETTPGKPQYLLTVRGIGYKFVGS
ncbi:MAG: response regulator transcription factor [Akkermansiaceae bacterium]|nr:response regulator transcription factor [Armatimonadota bacterium]